MTISVGKFLLRCSQIFPTTTPQIFVSQEPLDGYDQYIVTYLNFATPSQHIQNCTVTADERVNLAITKQSRDIQYIDSMGNRYQHTFFADDHLNLEQIKTFDQFFTCMKNTRALVV